jgi:hypothetical protein
MRGLTCFSRRKGLRGGPAPLTLVSLGRWASIATAAGRSRRLPCASSEPVSGGEPPPPRWLYDSGGSGVQSAGVANAAAQDQRPGAADLPRLGSPAASRKISRTGEGQPHGMTRTREEAGTQGPVSSTQITPLQVARGLLPPGHPALAPPHPPGWQLFWSQVPLQLCSVGPQGHPPPAHVSDGWQSSQYSDAWPCTVPRAPAASAGANVSTVSAFKSSRSFGMLVSP